MGIGLDPQDGRVAQGGLVDELHGVEDHHEREKVSIDLAKQSLGVGWVKLVPDRFGCQSGSGVD